MAVKKTQRCTRAPREKSMQQILESKKQKEEDTENNKDRRTIIIAQEIKFARLLSSNDKRIRDKILKNLRKWLTVRARSSFAFTDADFTRLWKGLFYCMWMSDKPLVQEELAESLSKIVHCFDIKDVVVRYTMCALQTLGTEWFGIDQYRLDKFSMLLRRIIRQTFVKCKERSWDMKWIEGFAEILEKLFLNPKICLGFNMHITEVFLEELSKISSGDVPEDVITELIKPFVTYFIIMDDERQIRHVMRHIFRYLIFQSDVGMDYQDKFQAWQIAGFPSGSIDDIEKIEVSDEEQECSDTNETDKIPQNQLKRNTEKSLDPRAGKLDVELSQIPFNAKKIVALLTQYKYHPSSTTKSRRQLNRLLKEFTELSEGRMPLGVKEIHAPNMRKKATNSKSAAIRLLNFEKELYSDSPQKKHKRKRNNQVVEDEKNTFSDEESDEINDENSTVKVDDIENIKKRKKREMTDICNETHAKSQVSDMNIPVPQKKENETKEKLFNDCKVDVKNNNSKARKKSFLVLKSNNECENVKLKKNKIVTANNSSIKKKGKLKICNRWDVSDNIILSTPTTLINSSKESCLKTNKKPGISLQKKKSRNQLPAWMLPVVKKVENEKNEIVRILPEQNKANNFSNSKKRVKIALQRNTAQHTSEYILQVQKSPSIPFDANKKPLVGVLKASPIPSPINPFYRQKC